MAMTILDATTATAVYACTDQDAQVQALKTAFSGSVICKWYNGTTLLASRTYSGWTLNTLSSPRSMTLATKGARTFSSGPTAANKVVFNNGTTDIFQVTSAVGGGDINMDGVVTSAAGENLSPLVITAKGTLPILDLVQTLANGMSSGTWLDITANTNVQAITDTTGPGGLAVGWLEGADPSAAKNPLTQWNGNMTHDTTYKRVMMLGCTNGYSSESPAGGHSNLLEFDCTNGQFSKTWNPVNENIAHQYDANCANTIGGYLYRWSYLGGFYKMALATNTWTYIGDGGVLFGMTAGFAPSGSIHPGIGTSGSFIAAGSAGKIAKYDIQAASGTVLAASCAGVGGPEVINEYHPGIGKVIFGGGTGGTKLYTLDSAGTIALFLDSGASEFPTGVTTIGPDPSSSGTVLVPDPQGRALAWLFDVKFTGRLWKLNLTTKAWTDMGALDAGIGTNLACYGCLTTYGVIVAFVGVNRVHAGDTTCPSTVVLYKPA